MRNDASTLGGRPSAVAHPVRQQLLGALRAAGRRVPVEWRRRAILQAQRWREPAVRRAFERTPPGAPLSLDQLRALCEEFPVRPNQYGRAADDYLRRGEERAGEVARHLPAPAAVLEVGGGDGMVSCALRRAGYQAVLTDIDLSGLDGRVRSAGVPVTRMDATRLGFGDATFDAVFSYNAFEHLPDPGATLAEMRRILRPGGLGFVAFAALGFSPGGAHLYNEIGVPYVTLLCDAETIAAYRRERRLDARTPWINGWPVERFRELFGGLRGEVETLEYAETRNLYHLGFIRRFLPQLRRAPSWDSLVVEGVRFVFRVPGAGARAA